MQTFVCLVFLLTVFLPAPAAAQESDFSSQAEMTENAPINVIMPEAPVNTWGFTFHLGSFSSSNDRPGSVYPARGQADFELTRYFSERSAFSFNMGGAAFEARHIGIAAITGGYKFFPVGNGTSPERPPILPWVGGGFGIYVHEPVFYPYIDSPTTIPGGYLTGGAAIPMGNIFELSGEIRYAVTQDFRLASYLIGFGFRF